MGNGIFIIGTDTDVGKTFTLGAMTYALKNKGKKVIPYKPVQSGGLGDTKYIKEICDLENDFNELNTYTLKEAVSPHLASTLENIEISKENIINHYKKLINNYDYVLVEGAGGIVVPLLDNKYFIYDLIKELNLDVVIVARAGVGTINHTVLTNEFLKLHNIKAKGVIINGYNGNFYEDDNIKLIKDLTNLEIIHKFNKLENLETENIKKEYEKLDVDKIIKLFN